MLEKKLLRRVLALLLVLWMTGACDRIPDFKRSPGPAGTASFPASEEQHPTWESTPSPSLPLTSTRKPSTLPVLDTPTPAEGTINTPTPPPTLSAPGAIVGGQIHDMELAGYRQEFLASITGPKGETYYLAGYRNQRLMPDLVAHDRNPEICRLLFYRQEKDTYRLMANLDAPQYPPDSRFSGYPFECRLVDWDAAHSDGGVFVYPFLAPEEDTRQALKMDGFSSDINGNGLPEFAVWAWYCPSACSGDEGSLHFYEVQEDGSILQLTKDLPGVFYPWQMLVSKEPLAFYVFDVAHEVDPHVLVENWWVFTWDGSRFVDASSDYQRAYRQRIDEIAGQFRDDFGEAFPGSSQAKARLLSILFLADTSDQRAYGLETFLDLTDLENWPDTDSFTACWLQLQRATAQDANQTGESFSTSPHPLEMVQNLPDLLAPLEEGKYDVSACRQLLER